MIQLPKNLQPIHTFEEAGVWYVAHLQSGDVLKIDPLTAEILTLCSTTDSAGIVKKLADKYTEGEILESLKNLSGDMEEFLFKPEAIPAFRRKITQSRLRIFIPHGFMKYREVLGPTLNAGIYNLLVTLTKYADVFVEADNNPAVMEQREQLMALGIAFVSDLFESNKNTPIHAANRSIIEDCDGILTLSPHPHEELNYFRHNTIPVISRVFSDRNLREATINKVLSHQSLHRSFDVVCPDTPWIAEELEAVTGSHFNGLTMIPSGVDTEVYSPQNRQQAREVVASIVETESILQMPCVGFINGFQPQNSLRMIEELAVLHKDLAFIILDPILSRHHSQKPRNVFYIDLQSPEDTLALSWIYSACEFVIFPSVIGTPFSMVLEALACGVPTLALAPTGLPEDLGRCIKSVPITRETTTGKFVIPTAAVSEEINALLGAPKQRAILSRKAREIASNYSWDQTAREIIQLFTDLNEKKLQKAVPTYPDVAFSSYYNKAENVVKSGALQFDGSFQHRVEEGLAQTLLAEHTPEEVGVVLRYLLKDAEKADKVLSTLIS